MANTMRAVWAEGQGGPEVLRLGDRPRPRPRDREVLVRVAAASVNRPDISQRRGIYPPPHGVIDILGLDLAGIVVEVGAGVTRWRIGDRVCALVQGGAYAEFCVVPQEQVLPVPFGLSLVEAAALPEIFFTAWNNLVVHGRMRPGERLLLQGGTSGVGTAAIQIAKQVFDARVVATAGTGEKRTGCIKLGADDAIDYHLANWDEVARKASGDDGFDLVLDSQSGDYTAKHINLLREDGRLVLIAAHRGGSVEVDLLKVLLRRLVITGSTIRPRPPEYKASIARQLEECVWPRLSDRRMKVLIHSVFDIDDAAKAHTLLDRNEQIGKVVLKIDPDAPD